MGQEPDGGPPTGGVTPLARLRHELRTPLGQIMGYAELLREDAEERGVPELLPDLGKIESAARTLLALLERTLPPSDDAPPVIGDGSSAQPLLFREDAAETASGAEAAGKGAILVVDDNELNRDMLCRRLGGRGYSVTPAADGPEALSLVDRRAFDLILLDVMMPGMSGLDVLRHIRGRSTESDLPVIMATARDAAEDVVQALRLGANDYVTKPLDFAVVLARVETQLSLKRQKEEIRRLADGLERRNRFIQRTFGRYLSAEIVEGLLDSPDGLRLGGEQRRVTIVMADLRGFTQLADTLGPREVVAVLNAYLGVMAEVILRYQGTIDEFIGDAILAIFGAPMSRPDDARRAVACALSMQLEMTELNGRFEAQGLPRVEMGVAIHSGDVVVGNIGSEKRAKYGVVGTPVNHTGRIESFTVGGQILISKATLTDAGPDIAVGERLTIDAKGAREPLVVHELRGIGGEYGICLPERVERFVRLETLVGAGYHVLEGKRVGAETYRATFLELSPWGGLMRSDRRLRLLSNLKISFDPLTGVPGDGDVYAKVVDLRGEDDDELIYLRFTSVPPGVETWLQELSAQRVPEG